MTAIDKLKETSQLTDRQEEVVDAVTQAGGDLSRAAELLGITRSGVWSALKRPKVQEELNRRARSLLATGIIPAVVSLKNLSVSADSEAVRLNASTAILDRAGMAEPRQEQVLAIQINLGD